MVGIFLYLAFDILKVLLVCRLIELLNKHPVSKTKGVT